MNKFGMKFEKWRPKEVLTYCAIMLIYGHYRENGAADIIFFFHQKMRN